MPEFTLHRNHLLRTTKGVTIKFDANKPVYVPPVAVPDAVAIGAQPVGHEVDVLPDEVPVEVPLTVGQRKERMFEAFQTLIDRNERNDFTASGSPNAKKVAAMVGFDVSINERNSLWDEFRQARAEKE